MGYETIVSEPHPNDERVRRIALDAPPHNVIDREMLAELTAALEDADRADEVDAIVLATEGEAFCSGADLSELTNLDFEEGSRWLTAFLETIDVLRETGKPAIAAVEGTCVAGGNELVMGCDLIVAGESARFGQPEVGVGSTAAGGGVQLLPLIVGEKRARELLLTGRLLSAAEAERYGLINRVVSDEMVEVRALELAREVLDNSSPQAYRTIKSMLSPWTNLGMIHRQMARDTTARVWASEEFRDRAEAFADGEEQTPRSFVGSRPTDRSDE